MTAPDPIDADGFGRPHGRSVEGRPGEAPPSRGRRVGVRLLLSGRPADGGSVFHARHREAWVRVRLSARLKDPQPRLHDLRHTCATFLLAAGLRSHVVADILGHEDAGLVDRLYGHALPEEIHGAGDALDAWREARFATGIATRGAEPVGTPC
jgi:integrase